MAQRTHAEKVTFINECYLDQKWPLDKLPYTDEIGNLHEDYKDFTKDDISIRDFWRFLVRLRKDGELVNHTQRKTSRKGERRDTERKRKFKGFGL